MMTVKALHIKQEKKGAAKSLEKLTLIEDFGPEGDAYGGPGERQITLLGEDDQRELEKDRDLGLCINRFIPNLTLSGTTSRLMAGDIYHLGKAVIRITAEKKVCHKGCSIIDEEKRICLLPGTARFAAILKSGEVQAGDTLVKRVIL